MCTIVLDCGMVDSYAVENETTLAILPYYVFPRRNLQSPPLSFHSWTTVLPGCAVNCIELKLPDFVCLSVRHASFFAISLRDLCRRLVARSIFASNVMYFENEYDKRSSRGAP